MFAFYWFLITVTKIPGNNNKFSSQCSKCSCCFSYCKVFFVIFLLISILWKYTGRSAIWLSQLMELPRWFSSVFSRSSEIRAWLQPEELTLLLIQLRRHQAKMAGVNSPSDAFTHLQHQQHSSLLGPRVQVRAPGLPPTSSTTLSVLLHAQLPFPSRSTGTEESRLIDCLAGKQPPYTFIYLSHCNNWVLSTASSSDAHLYVLCLI